MSKKNIPPEKLLHQLARQMVYKYGDTPDAYQNFVSSSKKHNAEFTDNQLFEIWMLASMEYAQQDLPLDYITPEIYNNPDSYKPKDYSDVGQATVLAQFCPDCLRYTVETGYLHYNGTHWVASDTKAQQCVHDLTQRQLEEASKQMTLIGRAFTKAGGPPELLSRSSSTSAKLNDQQRSLLIDHDTAKQYWTFAIKCRASKTVAAVLKEARPLLEIPYNALDAQPFLLNTPGGTYDLRQGLQGVKPHDSGDYLSKITAVAPGSQGSDLWQAFLQQIFCGDPELLDYIQLVCGLAAIGRVYIEALIIAVGDGRNGKSTFFNSIARVLGTYSGHLSADTLTQDCRRNVKPELAEVKGKRLLIAAELKSGTILSDSIVKQLCSTDEIFAEKKYHAPFAFAPCHTLVLYTNHLPAVAANDEGIWRRLIVIPFSAKIEGSSDIKNYADYLFEQAGPSILSWIIAGAQKVIALGYHLTPPKCVREAIAAYRADNDWLTQFLDSCCTVGPDLYVSSAGLYAAYRDYCLQQGTRPRSTTDFYGALANAGFGRIERERKRYIRGLSLTTPI